VGGICVSAGAWVAAGAAGAAGVGVAAAPQAESSRALAITKTDTRYRFFIRFLLHQRIVIINYVRVRSIEILMEIITSFPIGDK
jgi:hypothetical protein